MGFKSFDQLSCGEEFCRDGIVWVKIQTGERDDGLVNAKSAHPLLQNRDTNVYSHDYTLVDVALLVDTDTKQLAKGVVTSMEKYSRKIVPFPKDK